MSAFGETLRQERELRGVSLREIADATNISRRFLEAIENDRVEILPGGVFRRAFVRQYASYLGLDADRVVEDFKHAHPPETKPPSRPPVGVSEGAHPGTLFVVALVVLAAVLSLMKLRPQDTESSATAAAPPGVTVPQQPVDRVYQPETSLAVEDDALVLTMNAQQSCWVKAEVDGDERLNRVLTAGESATIEADGEIVLSVGNAGGLSFSVNNREGLPLGDSGEVRRNIVITRQNLKSLLAEVPKTPDSGPS